MTRIGVKGYLTGLLGLALLFTGKNAQAVEICGETEKVDVDGKTYVVQNNIWGASTPQCVNVDGTSFEVTKSEHNMPTNDAPASYPCIFRGCHWGDCTNNSGMPVKVGDIGSVPSSWSITTPGSGAWNAAYDIWFHTSSTTSGQPDAAEIMIWINSRGGVQPAGSIIANDVSIEGATWDVWFYTGFGWNYIAYERTNVTTSVNFDLNGFFTDARSRGYLESQWYLIDVEAGFEIWQGGVGLKTNSFSCTIGGEVPSKYVLSITTEGSGSVSKSPDESLYEPGTSVSLTANPSSGYTFTGWSGDLSGTDNPAQIVMDSDKSVTATFNEKTQNSPPTDISISSSNVSEDLPVGTTVGTFSTTDPDGGDTHTYTLVQGSGSDDNASFTIDGSSLKTNEVFIYSEKSTFHIRVKTDDGNGGTFEKEFTIKIKEWGDTGASFAKVTDAPSIDGNIDDVWSNADVYSLENVIVGEVSSSQDLSATFRGAWDNSNLYVLAEVKDDILNNSSGDVWENDVVEVFIDADNSKSESYGSNDYQYQFVWNSTGITEKNNKTSGVSFDQKDTQNGYVMEILFPWSTIGTSPDIGTVIGFELQVGDNDGNNREGKLAWEATNDDAWQNPSLFGTAKLASANISSIYEKNISLKNNTESGIHFQQVNTVVHISYKLPKESDVAISIFNINGKTIQEYLCSSQSRGIHALTADFGAMNITSGIYFIKIKAGNRVINGKFDFIR